MSSPAIDHAYRYAFESRYAEGPKRGGLQLATSGGAEDFPYFFQGRLKHPRTTAQGLRVLAKVVGSRFHIPPAMLKRILAERDPVVTSGGGLLRFEGFSACCSTYARLDLPPEAYDGVTTNHGTTNVDFNPAMRAALAQIRDTDSVGFAIGTDEVTLLRGIDQIVERRVPLPLRWLKGFVEIQAYQARMELRATLSKIETLRFLRGLPRNAPPSTAFWATPTGTGLRLSQRESPEGIKLTGLSRLRLLEDLAPFADRLRVFADPRGDASEWELGLGATSFRLTVSAEVWRGFSGEGQVLGALATGTDSRLLDLVRGLLKWQAVLPADEFAQNWDTTPAAVTQALSQLGSLGLVGYDTTRNAYFHRELPFDLGLVEELHPRLKAAHKLLATDGVKLVRQDGLVTEADVNGSNVVHRVRLTNEGAKCTCPWFAKNQGARGPCKHILAAQIKTAPGEDS